MKTIQEKISKLIDPFPEICFHDLDNSQRKRENIMYNMILDKIALSSNSIYLNAPQTTPKS